MKENRGKGTHCLKYSSPTLEIQNVFVHHVRNNLAGMYQTHFHPRWLPKPTKTSTKCNIESCEHPVYSRTNLVTVHRLQEVFHKRVAAFDVEPGQGISIALCTDHYLQMYRRSSNATLEEVRMDNSNVRFIYSE